MSLVACFVTKNHAASLARALESVRSLADTVLVADTGSTDATCDIARHAGAILLAIPWADDFAAACNRALDAATGDWIVWMNPDEELNARDVSTLASALNDPTAFAFQLSIRQQLLPNRPDAGTVARQERLFRRTPEVRYIGRVHPAFLTPLAKLAEKQGQTVKVLEVEIVRHAYHSTNTPDKMRWVVRLLEQELADRPDRLSCKIELGRNLLWLNDPRGHTVLAEAAQTVAQYENESSSPDPMVGMLFEYLLTADPKQVSTALPLERVRGLVPIWFSRNPPVLWAAAQERFRVKDYTSAVKLLDRLLEIGNNGWYDCPEGFNPEIVGTLALLNLGLSHSQLGDWLLARGCFEHLLTHPVYGAEARAYFAESDARWRASLPQGP